MGKETNESVKKEEQVEYVVPIRGWRHTDKFPCPKCGKKVGFPYVCEPCNVVIKLRVQF